MEEWIGDWGCVAFLSLGTRKEDGGVVSGFSYGVVVLTMDCIVYAW